MTETCQRCGEAGQDRRTLWMACFYAMNELCLPFGQVELRGTLHEQVTEEGLVPIFGEAVSSDHDKRRFFTLRVCKECRADWMEAIKSWFAIKPARAVAEDPERNIPLRINGAVRMLTLAEYEAIERER